MDSDIPHGLILHVPSVGTRNYYRKLGYELDGPYMSKEILL
eukprot:TCALIF_08405-PA protein Name:"Similar to Elp3 Probable elongator complex protein 3 (Drosophila melanogaster)" AED:0.21 eAED:0.21 QI:0/0.75/0.8/0.8/0/0/5/2376/40